MSSGTAHWYNCGKCQEGPCGVCAEKNDASEERVRLKKEKERKDRKRGRSGSASSKESSKPNKRRRRTPKRRPVTSASEKGNLAAWSQVPPQFRGSVAPPPKKQKARRVKRTKKPRKGKGKGKRGRTGKRRSRR